MISPAFKDLALSAGLVAVSLATAIILGEITLRILGQPRTYPAVGLFQPDPDLGYRLAPDFRGAYVKGGLRFSVQTNASGFRDPRDFSALPEAGQRLVAVGDSFAFGMPVESDETFLSVLERVRSARSPDSPWQVLNLGVPSYGTRQELRVLKTWAPRLEADAALVVVCLENDLRDNGFPPSAPYYRAHGGIQVTQAAAAAAQSGLGEIGFQLRLNLSRLVLYDFVRYRLESLTRGLTGTSTPPPEPVPEDWEATRVAFEAMVATARTLELPLFALLIPEKALVLDPSAADPDRKRLTGLLEQIGVPVLDATGVLRDDPRPERFFEIHGTHFSVAGNERVGRFLAKRLPHPVSLESESSQ